MKRDLAMALVVAVVLIGWWTMTTTSRLQQTSVAGGQAPAAAAAATSAAERSAADAPMPVAASGTAAETRSDGDPPAGIATAAEFLAFVTECKARIGSDPFYSRFVDNHPDCVPGDRLVARYNEMHVLPYHPVVADNCAEQYSAVEASAPGVRCQLRPRLIYLGASKEELLGWMEAGDAVAASLLVEFPTATPQERFDAALAAYRLSGKPAELVRYVEQHVADAIVRVDRESLEDFVDREPSAIAALNGYVLSRIARNAGDPRAQPEHWKQLYVEHARHLSPDEFDLRTAEESLEALVASQLSKGAGDA
ncbi:MAG: hypothetical protein AAGG11_07760 [Pseudomonadota bacterium]